MDFVKQLRKLMDSKNLSIYGIARICDVPAATINRWLNGKYLPKLETLEKICSSVGVTLAEFFEDDSLEIQKNESDNKTFISAITRKGEPVTDDQARRIYEASTQGINRQRMHQILDRVLDEYDQQNSD